MKETRKERTMGQPIAREKVDDDLFMFLRTIYHYERNIAAQFGLNYQEIYLLQTLRRKSPQCLTDIAKVLDIPMFSASRLVERLVKQKLLTKEKDSRDRRSIQLTLLPEGEKIVERIAEDSYTRITQNLQNLDEKNVDSLFRTTEILYRVLGIPLEQVK
jgi:DNA-binding MarR family transcriptional regulator